ncbi:MaoC family dehydratase [Castellaniella sp.]|uniref:MaoC family dehydratase n=1 Tax=Castellaniella sp. TaxID=1955812 RepID=UPI003C71FF87
MKQLYFEDLVVGAEYTSRGRTITDADIRLFIGATGDDHPHHTDAEYCKNHPVFERPCAQGVLVLSVSDTFFAYEIGFNLAHSLNYGHDKIRYLLPVYDGDTVHSVMRIAACEPKDATWGRVVVECNVHNQKGQLVLVNHQVILAGRRPAA